MIWKTITDNYKYVISTRSLSFYRPNNHGIVHGWETLVCPVDRYGEPNVERSVVSRKYTDEDEAYLGHLNLYIEWNNK